MEIFFFSCDFYYCSVCSTFFNSLVYYYFVIIMVYLLFVFIFNSEHKQLFVSCWVLLQEHEMKSRSATSLTRVPWCRNMLGCGRLHGCGCHQDSDLSNSSASTSSDDPPEVTMKKHQGQEVVKHNGVGAFLHALSPRNLFRGFKKNSESSMPKAERSTSVWYCSYFTICTLSDRVKGWANASWAETAVFVYACVKSIIFKCQG